MTSSHATNTWRQVPEPDDDFTVFGLRGLERLIPRLKLNKLKLVIKVEASAACNAKSLRGRK